MILGEGQSLEGQARHDVQKGRPLSGRPQAHKGGYDDLVVQIDQGAERYERCIQQTCASKGALEHGPCHPSVAVGKGMAEGHLGIGVAGEDEGFGVVSFRYIDTVDPAGGDIGRGIDGAATEAVGGARDLSGGRALSPVRAATISSARWFEIGSPNRRDHTPVSTSSLGGRDANLKNGVGVIFGDVAMRLARSSANTLSRGRPTPPVFTQALLTAAKCGERSL